MFSFSANHNLTSDCRVTPRDLAFRLMTKQSKQCYYYGMDKSCITCSMPLEHEGEIGAKLPEGFVCIHCAENGKVKSCKDIFEGGIDFFLSMLPDADRSLAEKLTRRNMKSLPYWQANPDSILNGPVASDKEFASVMDLLE